MAKKFIFKLDPVLKIRSYKVKEAKEDLGKTVSQRVRAELEMESKNDYLMKFMESKTGKLNALDLQAHWNHKAYVEDEINNLGKERRELLKIEDKKRTKLENAMMNEKVISNLKERRITEYNASLQKEETIEMDEIGRNMTRLNRDVNNNEP